MRANMGTVFNVPPEVHAEILAPQQSCATGTHSGEDSDMNVHGTGIATYRSADAASLAV